MAKIFVSYRRADNAAGYAMDMARTLRQRFGERHVFRDMRSIPPGVDFGEYIQENLQSCTVMLVMIGRHWTSETTPDGRPRLFEPDDWVRQEVAAALAASHVRVIPVLVGGGTLPSRDELPPELQPLVRRNAVSLEDKKWESDTAALLDELEKLPGLRSWWDKLPGRFGSGQSMAKTSGSLRKKLAATGAAIVVVAVFVAVANEEGWFDTATEAPFNPAPDITAVPPYIEPSAPPLPSSDTLNVDQKPVINEHTGVIQEPLILDPPITFEPSKGGDMEPYIAPPEITVSGLWMDGQGNQYQFDQYGQQIDIAQIGGLGAGMGSGDGFLDGNIMMFEFYYGEDHVASGDVVISPDGRTMQGTVDDHVTGISGPIYLQRF